jgi:hypothetical protein
MDKFWDKIEEGLAGEFNLRALSPALFFWGTGFLLWGLTRGWDQISDFLTNINVTVGVILAIGLLFLLEISTWVSDWLKLPVLQFLEGYWRRWPFKIIRERLTERIDKELQPKRMRLDQLALKEDHELSKEEKKELSRLEAETNRYPEGKEYLLPTQLGNLLRASEQYPYRVYGLEILTIFPRLWLILPENAQKEVSEARAHMDNQVKMIILGFALFLWAFLAWWIIPIGILIAVWGYRRAVGTAETYGLLMRTTFDLYRFDLYKQLHLDLPKSPAEDIEFGIRVTQALARGLKPKEIVFKHPEK